VNDLLEKKYILITPNILLRITNIDEKIYKFHKKSLGTFPKKIYSYDDKKTLNIFEKVNWTRIIIDEFQDIMTYNQGAKNPILNLKCRNKWLMSGTPISNSYSKEFILSFLIDIIPNYKFNKSELLKNDNTREILFNNMFRKNTLDIINYQINLDVKIINHVEFITLSTKENILYGSEKANNNILKLLMLCCCPFSNDDTKIMNNIDEVLDYYYDSYIKKYKSEKNTIKKYNIEIQKLIERIVEENNNNNNDNNIVNIHNANIRKYENEVNKCIKLKNYFKSQVNYFAGISNTIDHGDEDIACNICKEIIISKKNDNDLDNDNNDNISDDEEDNPFTNVLNKINNKTDNEKIISITDCGHIYCDGCIKSSLKISNPRCPLCRKPLNTSRIISYAHNPENNSKFNKEINLYGTKIFYIVSKIKEIFKEDKLNRIIIFCEWDNVLQRIKNILNTFGINMLICQGNANIKNATVEKFNDDSNCSYNIMGLSIKNCSSGLNLTKANHIIFANTINGALEKIKSIENQAIGRCHRIGQNKDIHVYKYITKNTIEEEIYNKIKMSNKIKNK